MLTKFEKDMLSFCRAVSDLGIENVTKEELYNSLIQYKWDLQNMISVEEYQDMNKGN